MRVTQALGREETNAAGFAARSDDYRRSRMRAQTAISIYFPFVALLSELAAALVLGVGRSSGDHRRRERRHAHRLRAVPRLLLLADPAAVPDLRRLPAGDGRPEPDRRSAVHPDVDPAGRAPDPGAAAGRAGRLPSASGFRYSTAQPGAAAALDGVDLDIRSGETIAVVGPTGAGKSTLVKLIARYYDVTSGSILIDGIDVREFDLGSLPPAAGGRPAGTAPVHRNRARQHRLRQTGCADADVEAAARAVGAIGAIGGLQRWIPPPGRGTRPQSVGGPAAIDLSGPRGTGRPGTAAARRGDRGARSGRGGGGAGGHRSAWPVVGRRSWWRTGSPRHPGPTGSW